MPIEIREVVIKTTVEKEAYSSKKGELSKEDMNEVKKEVLKNCEQLINKMFKQQTRR